MSAWSSLEFEFESSSGERLMVGFNTFAEGSYEEPQLGLDGDIMIRSLRSDTWETLNEAILSAGDRKRIEEEAERLIIQAESDYATEIGQDIAESRADALYEAWKDRDHD